MVSARTYEICLLCLMFLCLKHTFNCLRIIFLEHSSPPATFQSLSLMAKIVNRFLLSFVVVKTSFQTEYNCLDHSHALNLLNHVSDVLIHLFVPPLFPLGTHEERKWSNSFGATFPESRNSFREGTSWSLALR